MTGSAVSTATATTSTVTQIPKIALFGVLFALFVLILTTTSFAEPVIVLLGLGLAVDVYKRQICPLWLLHMHPQRMRS